jgi:dTDP-4-amino-4,6-dideoxygalactose transaminase
MSMSTTFPAIVTPLTKPAPAWPSFDEDEIAAAVETLRSGKVNYWTGQQGRLFEREFAEFSGCVFAVAVANGTVAIELALRSLGIGPGDEVVTTCRTYIATASAVVAVGATPVFADVDRESQNITADSIRPVISPRTRAIIAVHLAGWPCDMGPISELARENGLFVIEDCAQAHGARYEGRPVGSLGDVATFSFCQDKIMTTAGEGGMVTSNNEALWRAMWAYKDHGKSYDAVYSRAHAPGFRWLHESFGTNWRLSEVQSAVGRVQLGKLRRWVALRRSYAGLLASRWKGLRALRIPAVPEPAFHSYYKFYAFVRPEELAAGWDRDRIANTLASNGIACGTGSCGEVYLEKAFPAEMRPPSRLPVARELGETSLMFQVHPTLELEDMERLANVVEEVVLRATCSDLEAMPALAPASNESERRLSLD